MSEDRYEELRKSQADLVLALRLAAEDLLQTEPSDSKELEAKLSCLLETVLEGCMAVCSAADAYAEMPQEPEAVNVRRRS